MALPRTSRVILAWVVAIAAGWAWAHLDEFLGEEPGTDASAVQDAVPGKPDLLAGRLILGMAGLSPSEQGSIEPALGMMGASDDALLWRASIAARLGLVERAREDAELVRTREPVEGATDLRPLAADAIEAIDRVDREGAEPLRPQVAERLRAGLGWYGEILVEAAEHGSEAPIPEECVKLVTWFIMVLGVVGAAGLVGLGYLIVLAVLASTGRVRSRLAASLPDTASSIELFSVAMLVMLGLAVAAHVIVSRVDRFGSVGGTVIAVLGAASPLLALFLLRRKPGSGRTYGLTLDGSFLREAGIGVLTWFSGFPLLLLGLLLTLVIGAIFGESAPPSHPVQKAIIEGGTGERILLFLLAAGIAPVVEEVFFRGVLYGHLRALTGRAGVIVSMLASALLSSAFFALIHPQGAAFAPVLAGLALAFCIAREWRGSLAAPMVAHACNNGAVLALNVALFG